jgi:hypothetical protein
MSKEPSPKRRRIESLTPLTIPEEKAEDILTQTDSEGEDEELGAIADFSAEQAIIIQLKASLKEIAGKCNAVLKRYDRYVIQSPLTSAIAAKQLKEPVEEYKNLLTEYCQQAIKLYGLTVDPEILKCSLQKEHGSIEEKYNDLFSPSEDKLRTR